MADHASPEKSPGNLRSFPEYPMKILRQIKSKSGKDIRLIQNRARLKKRNRGSRQRQYTVMVIRNEMFRAGAINNLFRGKQLECKPHFYGSNKAAADAHYEAEAAMITLAGDVMEDADPSTYQGPYTFTAPAQIYINPQQNFQTQVIWGNGTTTNNVTTTPITVTMNHQTIKPIP